MKDKKLRRFLGLRDNDLDGYIDIRRLVDDLDTLEKKLSCLCDYLDVRVQRVHRPEKEMRVVRRDEE